METAQKNETADALARAKDLAVACGALGLAKPADAAQAVTAIRALGLACPEATKYAEIPWTDLERSVPGAKRLQDITEENRRLQRIQQALRPLVLTCLEPLLVLSERLHDEPNLGHALLHAELKTAAISAVGGYTADTECPVCGLIPDSWPAVQEKLREQLSSVQQLRKELRTKVLELTQLQADVEQRIATLDVTHGPDALLTTHRATAETLSSSLQWLGMLHRTLEASPPQGMVSEHRDVLRAHADALKTALAGHLELLLAHQKSLETESLKLAEGSTAISLVRWRALAKAIDDHETAQARVAQTRRRLKETEALVDAVQAFAKSVNDAESELSAAILTQVETDVASHFALITDQTTLVPHIRIGTENGVRVAEVVVRDFHGMGEVPARDFLSEAYRNALGLAILFAGLRSRSPLLETLVLDDVTQSSDALLRSGLLSVLLRHVPTRQLIVFTHDKNWYERVAAVLDKDTINLRAIAWSPGALQLQTDQWQSFVERAESRIKNLDPGAGNSLRFALEEFVDEACERLRVKLPFRTDVKDIKFEEKRVALTSRVNEAWLTKRGLIDPNSGPFKLFATAQSIANLSSHHASYDKWDFQDLIDGLHDLKTIIALFTCKNPYGKGSCGAIIHALETVNGLNPDCKRCKKPITL